MRKLSEALTELGIDFGFPIRINNAKGYETYFENSEGYCSLTEYDAKGNVTYFKNSESFWRCSEYDADGKRTYFENSNGLKRGTKEL